jgi:hypothetical protein
LCAQRNGSISLNPAINALLSESKSGPERQSFDVLSEIIEKAALDLQPRGERNHPDWFSENETKLFKAIEHRNEAYNESTKDPSSSALKHKLRHCRKLLRNVVKSSKATWLSKKAKRVANKLLLNAQGGDAWQAIKEINAGITGHHSSRPEPHAHKECIWRRTCQPETTQTMLIS